MIPTFSKASFYSVPVSATGKVCSLAFWSSQAEEEKNLAVGNLLPKQSFHKLRHFVLEFQFKKYAAVFQLQSVYMSIGRNCK